MLAHDDRFDLWMFEAQALHRVSELDVDAKIVRIERQLVPFKQTAPFADVHQQAGDVAVVLDVPVPAFRRISLKIDNFGYAHLPGQIARMMHYSAVLRRIATISFYELQYNADL